MTRAHIDSLVRGRAGLTDVQVEGRVYALQKTGVAVVDAEGRQWIIYEPTVLDKPRPLHQRTDVPARLR